MMISEHVYNRLRSGDLSIEALRLFADVRATAPLVLQCPQLPLLALEDPAGVSRLRWSCEKTIQQDWVERMLWPWRGKNYHHPTPDLVIAMLCLEAMRFYPEWEILQKLAKWYATVARHLTARDRHPKLQAMWNNSVDELRRAARFEAIDRPSAETRHRDRMGLMLWHSTVQNRRTPGFFWELWFEIASEALGELPALYPHIKEVRRSIRSIVSTCQSNEEHERRRFGKPTPPPLFLATPRAESAIAYMSQSRTA